jgi:hypothetical protein
MEAVGRAFLPAEMSAFGKRERLPYKPFLCRADNVHAKFSNNPRGR